MFKRLTFVLLIMCGFAFPAKAQYTATSGQVLDPTGVPYTSCAMNISFVASPTATTQPFINGSLFQTVLPLNQCDSSGNFGPISIVDNNLVSDGHTGAVGSMWRFSVCSATGKYPGPPYCFTLTTTITGAIQNLTAALKAVSALLPTSGGGGGGGTPCVTTNRSVQLNSAGAFACAQGITSADGNTLTVAGNVKIGGGAPWFDITAPPFNAPTDGTSDAGPAFNSALQAAYAQPGGTVYIPPNANGFLINTCPSAPVSPSGSSTVIKQAATLTFGSGCPTWTIDTGGGVVQALTWEGVASAAGVNAGAQGPFASVNSSQNATVLQFTVEGDFTLRGLSINCNNASLTGPCVKWAHGVSGTGAGFTMDRVNIFTNGTSASVPFLLDGLTGAGAFQVLIQNGSFQTSSANAQAGSFALNLINVGGIKISNSHFIGSVRLGYVHGQAAPVADVLIDNDEWEATKYPMVFDSDAVAGTAGITNVQIINPLIADSPVPSASIQTLGTNTISQIHIYGDLSGTQAQFEQNKPISGLFYNGPGTLSDTTMVVAGGAGCVFGGANGATGCWGSSTAVPSFWLIGPITAGVGTGYGLAGGSDTHHFYDPLHGGAGISFSSLPSGTVARFDTASANGWVSFEAANGGSSGLLFKTHDGVDNGSYTVNYGSGNVAIAANGTVAQTLNMYPTAIGGIAAGDLAASHRILFDIGATSTHYGALFGTFTGGRVFTFPDASGTVCVSGQSTAGCIGTGATVALNNLATVAINTSLIPGAVNTVALGTAPLPFTNLFLGTVANQSTEITSSSTANRTQTLQDVTDTFVYRASTDIFTNKTFDTAATGNVFKINGTGISSIAGNTGKVVTYGAGSPVSGDCAKFDASGNIVDNGSGCSGGATFGWDGLTAATNTNVGTFAATGNTWDFSGVTIFKQRFSAGLTSSANGDLGYDTTAKNWHVFGNSVDNLMGLLPASITPTNNDCVKWTVAAGLYTLNTSGAGCGGVQPTFKTNGSNNSTQTLLNITNSSLFHSLGVTVTNTSGGIANLGLTGSFDLAGLTSPSANGDQVCSSAGAWTECVPAVIITVGSLSGATIASSQRGNMLADSNNGASAVTLPQAGSAGFGSSFYFRVRKDGTGAITITPTTSTIKQAGFTAASTLVIVQGETCNIQSDNTNYFADCSSNPVPFMNHSGVLTAAPHMIQDTATLSTGTVTVTLTGAAVFTSATSYACSAVDTTTAANAVTITQTSGSSITLAASGASDVIAYQCSGN